MKRVSESKQDLLLDALSCIDEDILARGLALRDGTAVPTAEAVNAPPKAAEPTPEVPPLYDLTRRPDKPPKKPLWRVLAVVAAACLLFCVVPLSMWMVGRVTESLDKAEDADGTLGDFAGSQNGTAAMNGVPNAPEDGWETDNAPEVDAPVETEESQAPEAEEPGEFEGVTEAETEFVHHEMVWSTVSKTDSLVEYTATGHNGTTVTLLGSTDGIEGIPFPAEDEMALQTIAQWLLSVCALDYGDHFPLFYESFVQEAFIKEAVGYGRTYQSAIQYMDGIAADLLSIDEVSLILHLEENTLLTEDELEDFRATKSVMETDRGFYPGWITAVRRIRVSGGIEIDGFQPADSVLGETFYLYEYEGRWYLDETFMDDDLSIDLLGTDKADTGFYKVETTTGTVVTVRENYLYLDTGDVFRMDGAEVYAQTDGGEWHETEVRVGDTVTVNHHSLTLEGLLSMVDSEQIDPNTEWELSTAIRIDIIG